MFWHKVLHQQPLSANTFNQITCLRISVCTVVGQWWRQEAHTFAFPLCAERVQERVAVLAVKNVHARKHHQRATAQRCVAKGKLHRVWTLLQSMPGAAM
jgi:hypothetical protein